MHYSANSNAGLNKKAPAEPGLVMGVLPCTGDDHAIDDDHLVIMPSAMIIR